VEDDIDCRVDALVVEPEDQRVLLVFLIVNCVDLVADLD
jgi:hypothetical protein